LACHNRELSILFTNDEQIAQLNAHYLGRRGPTNVMAFPMANISGEGFDSSMLGDVVISVDTALRESKECRESLEYTIERLLIHGILHLSGYDHEESDFEADRMEKEEKRLIALIGEDSENGTVGS